MTHPERKSAKRFDMPGRAAAFTDFVYSGTEGSWEKIRADQRNRLPDPPALSLFFGEIHGHSNLSDGSVSIDDYFTRLRDIARVDFCALSDHDHGGVGKPELWDAGKWELTRQKVREYYEPGKFTTLLAYERDSYPYYNNLVVYYRGDDGELLRGVRDGELTREELRRWLAREDLILVPHDTNILSSGADFLAMEPEDMTPLIQVYGRASSCAEYMGDPLAAMLGDDCEGGHWQDALKRSGQVPRMSPSLPAPAQSASGRTVVPDLQGLGLQDAIWLTENSGLKCSYTGTGHVRRQHPAPGTAVESGTTLKMELQ